MKKQIDKEMKNKEEVKKKTKKLIIWIVGILLFGLVTGFLMSGWLYGLILNTCYENGRMDYCLEENCIEDRLMFVYNKNYLNQLNLTQEDLSWLIYKTDENVRIECPENIEDCFVFEIIPNCIRYCKTEQVEYVFHEIGET